MILHDATGRAFNVTHPHLDVWEARPVDGAPLCVRRATLGAVKRALATLNWMSEAEARALMQWAAARNPAPVSQEESMRRTLEERPHDSARILAFYD